MDPPGNREASLLLQTEESVDYYSGDNRRGETKPETSSSGEVQEKYGAETTDWKWV
jgi:hypothetical protein